MKPNEVPNVSLRVIQYFGVENYINFLFVEVTASENLNERLPM